MSPWAWFGIWGIIAIAPIIHAWFRRTPISLAIGASLMMAYLFQATIEWTVDLNLYFQGALVPAVAPHMRTAIAQIAQWSRARGRASS